MSNFISKKEEKCFFLQIIFYFCANKNNNPKFLYYEKEINCGCCHTDGR